MLEHWSTCEGHANKDYIRTFGIKCSGNRGGLGSSLPPSPKWVTNYASMMMPALPLCIEHIARQPYGMTARLAAANTFMPAYHDLTMKDCSESFLGMLCHTSPSTIASL